MAAAGRCRIEGGGMEHRACSHVDDADAALRIKRRHAVDGWRRLIGDQQPAAIGGEFDHVRQGTDRDRIDPGRRRHGGGVEQADGAALGTIDGRFDGKSSHAIVNRDAVDRAVDAGVDVLDQLTGFGIEHIHALHAGHPQGIGQFVESDNLGSQAGNAGIRVVIGPHLGDGIERRGKNRCRPQDGRHQGGKECLLHGAVSSWGFK